MNHIFSRNYFWERVVILRRRIFLSLEKSNIYFVLKNNIQKDEILLIELSNSYTKCLQEYISNKEEYLNNKNIFQNNLNNKNKLKINENKSIKLKGDILSLNNSLDEIKQNIYISKLYFIKRQESKQLVP